MEAWIWLLLNANYEDRRVAIGAEIYDCKKGQMITSQKKLCKQFNWGNSRLRTFLKLLKNDGMIEYKSNTKLTSITIVKYSTYQDTKLQTNQKQITIKPHSNTNNNSNNINNINKNTIKDREAEFRNKVLTAGLKLPIKTHLLNEFCDYWTESNPNGTKMKFEMQKTFDISRRLKKWIRNSTEWDYKKKDEYEVMKKEQRIEEDYRRQVQNMKKTGNYASQNEIKNILKLRKNGE